MKSDYPSILISSLEFSCDGTCRYKYTQPGTDTSTGTSPWYGVRTGSVAYGTVLCV